MITACKSYITNNNTATIWSQPRERVMEKLQAAIRLKQVGGKSMWKTEYKVRFRRTWLGKLYFICGNNVIIKEKWNNWKIPFGTGAFILKLRGNAVQCRSYRNGISLLSLTVLLIWKLLGFSCLSFSRKFLLMWWGGMCVVEMKTEGVTELNVFQR